MRKPKAGDILVGTEYSNYAGDRIVLIDVGIYENLLDNHKEISKNWLRNRIYYGKEACLYYCIERKKYFWGELRTIVYGGSYKLL